MIVHDENREREVQRLAEQVFFTSTEFSDDPNGPYEWRCPFCYAKKTGGPILMITGVKMDELVHDLDCVWLIAKDLYSGEVRG